MGYFARFSDFGEITNLTSKISQNNFSKLDTLFVTFSSRMESCSMVGVIISSSPSVRKNVKIHKLPSSEKSGEGG